MRSTSASRTVRVLAIAAAAGGVFLAGCGGGGGNGAAAATNTSVTGGADTDAFRACLKEHGADLPDDFGRSGPGQGQPPTGDLPPTADLPPGGGPAGGQPFGNDPELQEAFNACRDKASPGGFGGARNSQVFQAYTSCLRDNGVEVPDPATATSTDRPTPPASFDRNDPDFAAANEKCQALLPTSTTTTVLQ